MAKFSNPLAFTRGPVTIITTLVYIAILTAVIVTQTRVPTSPTSPTPIHGINLTEAWNDLQLLSAQHHPYNSRRNDYVHDWLVRRIKAILKDNKVAPGAAYVFEDNISNLTFSSATLSTPGVSVYFEGTNIVVYIRGKEDDESEWWTKPRGQPSKRNGILVNAHYDSVSTGYGATDDGVGVISVLQLIRYYTTSKRTPQNGVVMLLNNGEEDFLNGANVFTQHPMSRFVSSFLNLEGAGAGGRAALFRSTDEEVTQAYASSPYPFGTVISGDAFEAGLVRSQTDYIVFNGKLGMRGLDVAFIAPRARYHTDQDDSRHTGKNALWHMVSAAVATTSELTKMAPSVDEPAHPAVWFDLFGEAFAVMRAHTFFALSVTVLVVGPILLCLTLVVLYNMDKFYLISASRTYHTVDGDESLPLGGWRGLFRFPIILILSSACPVALAYLLFKENPFIAHSSEWAVWSMMISSFIFIAWFLSRALDFARPSALTRTYGLLWLCGIWWVVLIVAIVFEEQLHLSGGYFVLFYTTSLFLATWFALLELFSLPKKSKYCATKIGDEHLPSRAVSVSRPSTSRSTHEDAGGEGEDPAEDANERSALLPNRGRSAYQKYARSVEERDGSIKNESGHHLNHEEQEWSKSMWTWLWVVEFLLIVPINVILLAQLGLYLVTALHQTGADGSSMFIVYLSVAILTIFMFAPILPLLHRFSWHIPIFLLLVLVGTLVYNLLAFPFSPQNRLKLFFQQEVDLDNGTNVVSLVGVADYVQEAIYFIPSAAGQKFDCVNADAFSDRRKCSWSGPPPRVGNPSSPLSATSSYKSLVSYNVTLIKNGSDTQTARFTVDGKNTRACKLQFDHPITDFYVRGQAPADKRFPPVPERGSKEIRLWSRTWDRVWVVDVTWPVPILPAATTDRDANKEDKPDDEGRQQKFSGRVVCMWSDINQEGVIPAFDEVQHFVPDWIAVTKAADGLVEGYKAFEI